MERVLYRVSLFYSYLKLRINRLFDDLPWKSEIFHVALLKGAGGCSALAKEEQLWKIAERAGERPACFAVAW